MALLSTPAMHTIGKEITLGDGKLHESYIAKLSRHVVHRFSPVVAFLPIFWPAGERHT